MYGFDVSERKRNFIIFFIMITNFGIIFLDRILMADIDGLVNYIDSTFQDIHNEYESIKDDELNNATFQMSADSVSFLLSTTQS